MDVRIADISLGFEDYLKTRRIRDKTLSIYMLHLKGFLLWFESTYGYSLDHLDLKTLNDYIVYLQETLLNSKTGKRLSATTIKGKVNALSVFNKFLLLHGMRDHTSISHVSFLEILHKLPNTSSRHFTVPYLEVSKFLNKIFEQDSSRNSAFVSLLAYTGIALNEATEMRISNLYLDLGYLRVEPHSRNDSTRHISLPDSTKQYLVAWLEDRNARGILGDFVFSGREGTPIDRTIINKLFNKYGGCITPRTLREYFILNSHYEGKNVYHIAESIGNVNITALEGYIEELVRRMEGNKND